MMLSHLRTSDTIRSVRIPKLIRNLAILAVIALLVYQIPAVNSRLSWRLELASVYLRGVIKPVGAVPTPLPQPTLKQNATFTPQLTRTPGPSPTLSPSPTPLPVSVSLAAPKWEKQDMNNCGPASLSLYLRFYGWGGRSI